ncbi:MAG: ABC transporter substrate-binding protein [Acidimicrobiales bacterium]
MPSSRRWLALALGVLCAGAVTVPMTIAGAAASANENAATLDLSLPGPFTGCSFLDPGATVSSDAILDLVRPSAFLTAANGVLEGEGGAIATTELISLAPETVRYTITPHLIWSDGLPFNGSDLVDWWQRARALPSVTSDGYRAIESLVVSTNGLSVTAVFSAPYADWDLLFRDVEAPETTSGCAVSNLASRPSLGPYEVTSATASRVILDMNPEWPLDTSRFGRVVITDTQNLPSSAAVNYADYTLALNSASILALSNHPALFSHIASSNNIEEMTFSPAELTTSRLAVRKALSVSIDRQALIDTMFGAITFSPSIAASVIYSQGQSAYPGPSGSNPPGQTTTTAGPTTSALADCESCAIAALRDAGYQRTPTGWVDGLTKVLTITLGVGPSDLDHAVATLVEHDWKDIGIDSTAVDETSDPRAAQAAALGRVDVALFARPTATNPSYAARSWAGPAYPDTYPSGVRLASVISLFQQALSTFNPVTASTTWLKLDQVIMNAFWIRPLFTAPSLVIWSGTLATVTSSFVITGFVDQIPTWSKVPITSGS